jgi:hypothetical protein
LTDVFPLLLNRLKTKRETDRDVKI